ncbi:hypothetical protein ABZZ17_01890 [Streptomyces sp. NPDC006512]|uniref:hypothetical protein n=1 Tax=Streptomyces sp. NPDC006512 TaxID=3154307 RepID=UPI0033AAD4BE
MRQRIALLAVCGLVAAGSVVPSAHAAETVLPLTGPAALSLPPHPATGDPVPTPLAFRVALPDAVQGLGAAGAEGFGGGDVTFTVDLSGIAGVASVREGGGAPVRTCTAVGTTLVCTVREPAPGTSTGIDLDVTAEPGGARGATGTVTVTGRAAGVTIAPAVTRITVGGPELVVEEMRLKHDPKPGESQPLPLAFANRGTQPARGVVLELTTTRGLELTERYDNCSYRTGPTSTTARCAVEGDFEAGGTYELAADSPLHLRAAAHARTELLGYGIAPAPAPPGPDRSGTDRPAVAGRKLTAVSRPAPAALRPAPPATAPRAGRREFAFAVPNTTDLGVEPLSVRGAAGARVRAAVVLRNHGPAWLFDPRSEAPAAVVDVRVPPGLKVTRAPAGCRAVGSRGLARYLCTTGPSVREAERIEFVFELKVEKAVRNAQGALVVGAPGPRGEPRRHPSDPYRANDAALFLGNATGSAATTAPGSPAAAPGPEDSETPAGTPGTGAATAAAPGTDGGGPLAPTGSTAGLLGFGGAALVAAGGALYVVFQRRRAGRA